MRKKSFIVMLSTIIICSTTMICMARSIYYNSNDHSILVKAHSVRNFQIQCAFVRIEPLSLNWLDDTIQVDQLTYQFNPDGSVHSQILADSFPLNRSTSPLRIDPVRKGETIMLVFKNRNALDFNVLIKEYQLREIR